MSPIDDAGCGRSEQLEAHVLGALPPNGVAELMVHVAECKACTEELEQLRSIVDSFVTWPTDVLRPSITLQEQLAERVAADTGSPPVAPPAHAGAQPEWEEVAPGIFCTILAADTERDRVSMLVHLVPGAAYPPHTHAGVEELHVLDGELWIDDRLLRAGDYNYGLPGTTDRRVYTETGCTCALVTSPSDLLG